jgi:octaprenyl-diphosphate synthase
MSSLNKIKQPINEELKKFENTFQQIMKSKVPLLNIITNFILQKKGKQMRPLLVFLSAKLLNEITSSTHTAAALIEILHTATLIHDDVVDDSYERRGYFSINALWKSKIAVLIGDYLLAQGLLLAINQNEYEVLRIVSNAVKEMSEGEILQIRQSRKLSITEEQYYEIIRKKTAALISACAACGAKSVGASDADVQRMAQFGENIGIAFQIKDDLLDYQVKALTGKPSGNDLKEKKITLPLIYSLQHSSDQERKNILSIINKGKTNNKEKEFENFISFITSKGGIEYSTLKMNEFKDKALQILDQYPDNPSKISLKEFALFTIDRKQ